MKVSYTQINYNDLGELTPTVKMNFKCYNVEYEECTRGESKINLLNEDKNCCNVTLDCVGVIFETVLLLLRDESVDDVEITETSRYDSVYGTLDSRNVKIKVLDNRGINFEYNYR